MFLELLQVAGLAAAAAICFSLRALIVLCGSVLVSQTVYQTTTSNLGQLHTGASGPLTCDIQLMCFGQVFGGGCFTIDPKGLRDHGDLIG